MESDDSVMFHEKLLDHFQNPRNVGELLPPAVVIDVSNPACGDTLRISARIENGKVVEAKYKVRGCTASIATGSALTGLMLARTAAELASITEAMVEAEVGELSPESRHAAVLCRDAARALGRKLSGHG
jgi:nitrogen fixation protein NifU and related proteins